MCKKMMKSTKFFGTLEHILPRKNNKNSSLFEKVTFSKILESANPQLKGIFYSFFLSRKLPSIDCKNSYEISSC